MKPATLSQYFFGYLITMCTMCLELCGILRIRGSLPPLGTQAYVVVCNHPSLFEAMFLPFSRPFFNYWWRSQNAIPYSTPAKENLKKLFYVFWCLFPDYMIPIDRRSGQGRNCNPVRRILTAIKSGRTGILFPEGTRTRKTKPEDRLIVGDREMGPVHPTTQKLIQKAVANGAQLIPCYTRVRWWLKIPIFEWSFGEPFAPENQNVDIRHRILAV